MYLFLYSNTIHAFPNCRRSKSKYLHTIHGFPRIYVFIRGKLWTQIIHVFDIFVLGTFIMSFDSNGLIKTLFFILLIWSRFKNTFVFLLFFFLVEVNEKNCSKCQCEANWSARLFSRWLRTKLCSAFVKYKYL